MIPVDAVITLILNGLFGCEANTILKADRDLLLINDFFKEKLGDKFIMIEDFWFWGYFITKGSGPNRSIEFNEDKFYTAEFLEPNERNRQKINAFLEFVDKQKNTSNKKKASPLQISAYLKVRELVYKAREWKEKENKKAEQARLKGKNLP